ncbi:DUF6723 family protein [Paraburkholderia terrae]|uniref:DUF6723 family protein n=1 Tax=Paraburkholderia terrae TaxID=311230 RepID=UPI0038620C48
MFAKPFFASACWPHRVPSYAIHVATTNAAPQSFVGKLTVVRKTDGRKLCLFEGAPLIGPFKHLNPLRKPRKPNRPLAPVLLKEIKNSRHEHPKSVERPRRI